MIIQSDGLTINGVAYNKGDEIAWYKLYPFFLVHMLLFGGSGFFMAYKSTSPDIFDVGFLYLHGGIAILVYSLAFVAIFGKETIMWLFFNSSLGVLGIYTEINYLLSAFDRTASDFPIYIHTIPFLYYVMYTFLLRQACLDIFAARLSPDREKLINIFYVALSLALYLFLYFNPGNILPEIN